MRILFVCSRNRLRSPTAAQVFHCPPAIETDSAGLAPDAEHVLEPDQVAWADLIVVMEARHKRRITKDYGRAVAGKPIAVLGIPDDFAFMQDELVALLRVRMAPYVRHS